jgi:uncharacterized protein DUF6805
MTPTRALIAITIFTLASAASASTRFDRRVVDTVEVGNVTSEENHGYAGADDVAGLEGGKSYRSARGYMRYAMTTFDDTDVTLECTFVALDSALHRYEIVVEDSVIATRTFSLQPHTSHAGELHTVASPGAPTVVEIAVPFVLTKGKTNIAVILRGAGSSTPSLRQLRTIQNHNELQ